MLFEVPTLLLNFGVQGAQVAFLYLDPCGCIAELFVDVALRLLEVDVDAVLEVENAIRVLGVPLLNSASNHSLERQFVDSAGQSLELLHIFLLVKHLHRRRFDSAQALAERAGLSTPSARRRAEAFRHQRRGRRVRALFRVG